MKKIGLFILACTFGLTVMAQNSASRITFKETSFDYGLINEDDGVAYHSFEFTNTGTTPLIIHRVATSCGCTTPEWPRQPIAPGKSGSIKVGYNPAGRPGPFAKTITVYNNSATPTVVLHIKGKVKPHVKTIEEIYRTPVGDMINFDKIHFALGRIYLGKTYTDTIKFLNVSSNPVVVKANTQGLNFLQVKTVPEKVKPKQIGSLVLTYNPDKRGDWGFVVDRFVLSVNDKAINRSPITITASIEEDFSKLSAKELENAPRVEFNTNHYDFGTVKQGDPVKYDFIMKNSGKSDLIIRKIKASCGCTTATPSQKVLKPGESTNISASFRTSGYSGRQGKTITVITNDPKNPTMILRLTGTVEKPN
ncbi:MAG: hypothetical protein PWR03_62 [Tenuifilum sp.]|jgi:hypothetical protein|uniref:DUF1573 domain-containing protein n=1 Tax=Tenuifilum sp. TaxID=2760880 RepID=UPI0024AA4783|nr:DUF1573 domain-containing protein [Tenuifilum sp.]MDI3525879.1 hypothetical protein [Tenuifilum sp.]